MNKKVLFIGFAVLAAAVIGISMTHNVCELFGDANPATANPATVSEPATAAAQPAQQQEQMIPAEDCCSVPAPTEAVVPQAQPQSAPMKSDAEDCCGVRLKQTVPVVSKAPQNDSCGSCN